MNYILTYEKKRWDIIIFKLLLLVWTISLPFKNAFYQGSWIALDLFFIIHLFWTKNFEFIKEIWEETKPLGLFFIGIMFSMLLSNTLNLDLVTGKSWSIAIYFMLRFGLIFVALSYFYKLNFFTKLEIIYMIFSGLILLGLTSVYHILKNPDIITNVTAGLKGSLGSRTGFGMFMGLGLVLSFTYLKDKSFKVFFILFFTFLTIFSFARSSWVASSVSVAIFMLLSLKKLNKKDVLYIIGFLLFLGVLFVVFKSFQDRFSDLVKLDSTGRFILWTHSIDMIEQNPIFGYGLDTFKVLPKSEIVQRYSISSTHNMMLEILLYTGIAGAVVYFAAVFTTMLKSLLTKNFAIFAILLYILIMSQFDSSAYASKEFLSFVTIFTMLLYSDKNRENT